MHKTFTTHSPNGYANRQHPRFVARRQMQIVLLLANRTDCETLSMLLSRHDDIAVLAAGVDTHESCAQCQQLCPQLLILDPKVTADALQQAKEMIRQRKLQHLLVLDDQLRLGRLASLIKIPAISYLTRQAGYEALVKAIHKIATSGQRVFEPAIEQQLQRTGSGRKIQVIPDQNSITELTPRELQVMELLALGYSVRECGKHLNIAESTIDNHKSRLMKKLGVHKTVEMAHIAIREGLIVV